MSHTIPHPFPAGPVDVTAEKIATIKEWYESARRDEDVATDPVDNALYTGQREAFEDVLHLVFGTTCGPDCVHPDE